MPSQRLWAFWRYDTFPYMLGAPVKEVLEDGWVTVEGYTGMKFRPIKLLPLKQGEKQWAKVSDLRSAHQETVRKLKREFNAKVQEVVGFDPLKE